MPFLGFLEGLLIILCEMDLLGAHQPPIIYDVKKSGGFTTAPGEIKRDRLALQVCNFRERFRGLRYLPLIDRTRNDEW